MHKDMKMTAAPLTPQKNTTKRLTVWAVVVGVILLIPFIFDMPWTPADYVFAGIVLFGAASAYELITRRMTDAALRVMVGVAIATVVMLVWAWAVAG